MKRLFFLLLTIGASFSASAELKFNYYSEQLIAGETYLVDIDQNGVNDFRFRVTQANSMEVEILDADKQIEVANSNSNLAAVLSGGVPIGNNAWNPQATTILLNDFDNQGQRFLGIRDVGGSVETYGWMAIRVDLSFDLVLESGGFETTGIAINTGQQFIDNVGINEANWSALGLQILQKQGEFTITNSSTNNYQLQVIDMAGKQVAKETLAASATFGNLLPGMYIATVIDPRTKTIAATRKVMVR